MPISGTLSRLTFGGTLFDTEQWACTLHVNGVSHNGTAEDFAQACSDYLATAGVVGSGTNGFSSAARLAFVKWNPIAPLTGLYVSQTSDTFDVPGNVRGFGQPVPGQLAVAISLTTLFTRGRGHAGRIFMPAGAVHASVDGSGQMPSEIAAGLAQVSKTFLNSVAAVAGSPVVVYSKVGQVAVEVAGVRVGSVVDTQRRRRSSLIEQYESVLL